MNGILVLGAGRFGRRIAEELKNMKKSVTVLDRDYSRLTGISDGIDKVAADCIEFILCRENVAGFDWIIPAVPLHVGFLWLLAALNREEIPCSRLDVPAGMSVPNGCYTTLGTLYVSYSQHLCPEDCPEPEGFCLLSGEERAQPLYCLLAGLDIPGFRTAVLQSRQIIPGAGGFSPAQLTTLKEYAALSRSPLLVATSCSCHAVIDGLTFI